mmetsp:Transcript_73007/g.152462  ORF Transcript_73007/g.152462 Transcript_73007/m.152462 type:complete len:103 (-) Transcript_73007:1345-1653(-)
MLAANISIAMFFRTTMFMLGLLILFLFSLGGALGSFLGISILDHMAAASTPAAPVAADFDNGPALQGDVAYLNRASPFSLRSPTLVRSAEATIFQLHLLARW